MNVGPTEVPGAAGQAAQATRGASAAGVLARAAYSLLLVLATPIYLLRLVWRSRREPLYRHVLGERLGLGRRGEPGRIWIHAVSLGETRAAAALVDELRRQRPGMRLLLTHGTATGREAGATLLQPGDAQLWLPYDTPGAVRRFFAGQQPAVGVLIETETWPNLLHAARACGVRVVLANARLSERSLASAERLAPLMRPAASCIDCALAQTDDDAERLRRAGVRDAAVLGNLKFDMAPAPALLERGKRWRAALARPVVLAASTREGEEAPLAALWRALPAPRPLLLVVPRHPQRFDEVAATLRDAGFALERRSAWDDAPAANAHEADVWLGDSLGEMPLYYALADVALLGGSFAPLGGQNLIEAAACGCPMLMGPHTFNFAEAAALALAAGAAERVGDLETALRRATTLAADGAGRRDAMAAAALAFARRHRGAAARTAAAILERLPA